jgi:hypothetical protein
MSKISWDKMDAHEWATDLSDQDAVSIHRTRPSRYDRRGCAGLVEDKAHPWIWCLTVYGQHRVRTHFDIIPDGSSVREAKKLAERFIAAQVAR